MLPIRHFVAGPPMDISRRQAVLSALSSLALAGGAAARAAAPLEAQGGQYSSFDRAQLFYRRMGKGPPVVLLHGFLSDGPRTWFNTGIAQAIAAAGFSVIAPDARAHGLSAGSSPPYPKDVLAMDVEALAQVLKLRSYRLFGYAMGARTAVRLMARGAKPERSVLGGVGGVGILDPARVTAPNIETIRTGRNARDARLGVLVQSAIRIQKLKPAALIAVLGSQVATPRPALEAIRTPILVLNGDKDDVEGSPTELATLFPSAAVMRTPGDHVSSLREARFAQLATAFLKSDELPARFAAASAL
jgi:pimeloyl-ACP methyl ester carboxylesterase